MKKPFFYFSAFALIVANLFLVSTVFAQKNPEKSEKFQTSKNAIPNNYIVVLNEDVVPVDDFLPAPLKGEIVSRVSEDIVSLFGGGRIHKTYAFAIKGFAVEMPREAALRLSLDPRVKYVEEDSVIYLDQTQTQPNPPSWGLDRIDQRTLPLNQSYTYTTTGAGVHAYIIDTGIRATHSEFTGRIGNGTDFVNDGQNGNDCDGHGTHVAGTVGGSTFGVAKQVTLHSVRIFGCANSGTSSSSIAAVDWVIANHIKPAVINMSLGGGYSNASNAAVTRAIAQGITVVASAGNDNNDACDKSPASAPDIITVGSTDINDSRSSFSNYGTCVDLFAPGRQIPSASFQSDTGSLIYSGTSMSAPHVTGVIARFLQANPSASPALAINSVINSATNGVVANPGGGSPNKLLFSEVTVNASAPPAPTATPAPAVRINEVGVATPYPSEINVSGLSGVIANTPGSVQVRIRGFSHTYPGEVAFLLEGPNGAKLLLQSYVAEGEDANNLVYTISDTGSPMSSAALLNGATYKPTALNLPNSTALPNFPAPGPGIAYNNPGPANGGGATLTSTFGGTNPNGNWKLYVLDASSGDRGRIDSWAIDFATATPQSPYGYIDSVDCNSFSGWAVDRNSRTNRMSVSVFIDGQLYMTTTANQFRGDLAAAGFSDGNSGWQVTTPAAIKDGRQHIITAFANGVPLNNAGSNQVTCSSASTPAPYGYVDNVNCSNFSGWLVDQNNRANRLDVSIFIDGQLYTTVTANQYRGDLAAAGFSDGYSGWQVTTPAAVKNGQPHTITAVSNNRTLINPGSNQVTCSSASTPAPYGYVDNLDCNAFSGWLVDLNNRTNRLDVSILIDGQLYMTTTANQFRGDLAAAGFSDGNSGWQVPAPASIRDGRAHLVTAVSNNRTLINPGSNQVTCSSGSPPAPYGYIDSVSCNAFSGWLVDLNNRTNRLDVSILIDGQLYTTVPANQYRGDIAAAGFSDGNSGWQVTAPAAIRNGQPHTITAVSNGRALNLGGLNQTNCSSTTANSDEQLTSTPILPTNDNPIVLPDVNPNASAVIFQGIDSTTRGNWVGNYGKQGRLIVGEKAVLPEWMQFGFRSEVFHLWDRSTKDARALLKSDTGDDRVAAALYSPTQFEMAFNFTDGQAHKISVYTVDWEGNDRQQTVEIVDPATGQVLDSRSINNFNTGVYLSWQIKGQAVIRFKNNVSPNLNAVISGVFIDTP